MGPTWVLSSPGGPHAGPMNLAIKETFTFYIVGVFAGLLGVGIAVGLSMMRGGTLVQVCMSCGVIFVHIHYVPYIYMVL